jgi:lipoate-protein ligase B
MSEQTESGELLAVWLGRIGFSPALRLQEEARDAIANGTGRNVLFLCEHDPVLTMGRRGSTDDLLWSPSQRAAAGLEVVETPRGGEVTLHAPGQLVAYPVVYVGKRIRAHVNNMADAAIAVLRGHGVQGVEFRWEHPGVWRDNLKFASVGVHVSRGIAIQGMSLNIAVEPALFGSLISCGLPQAKMVSLVEYAAPPMDAPAEQGMFDFAKEWAQAYAPLYGAPLRWTAAASRQWLEVPESSEPSDARAH